MLLLNVELEINERTCRQMRGKEHVNELKAPLEAAVKKLATADGRLKELNADV